MSRTIAPLRERSSRRPTGLPNPPLVLITGPEKTGKSYEAALGSGSDLVGMTYWIEIGGGESTADYYGKVPGARYEIVPHDGSYQDILDAIRWAISQPPVDGKPNMLVLDSATSLWDLLSDEVALLARHRAVRKAQENRRPMPSLDAPITEDRDLWNRAKDRWGEVLWLLRRHSGPTLLIARQEIVTAFENGQATRHTTRKTKAEKNLPAVVDAIVELRTLGEAYLTGVRTLHWKVKPGETTLFEDFSVDTLLRQLGFEEATTTRSSTELQPAAYLREQQPPANDQPAPVPSQRAPQAPQLTTAKAEALITKALKDENDPVAALEGIREEWGTRTLATVRTNSKWGAMSADALINEALVFIKRMAEKKATPTPTGAQSPPPSAPPGNVGEDQAREHAQGGEEHQEHALPEPPDEEGAPLPPDPQTDQEPPGEIPEDISAAEEPQDLPAKQPRPKRQNSRQEQAEKLARQGLMDEATVQARVHFVTVGEHLGPITENGDPDLMTLKNFVAAQRPKVIAVLEKTGETELANAYRQAPIPDLQIKKLFAPFLDRAPSSS